MFEFVGVSARDRLCFGVLSVVWFALLCVGLLNKAKSANSHKSYVFPITQTTQTFMDACENVISRSVSSIPVMPMMHFLSSRRVIKWFTFIKAYDEN